MSEIGVLTMSPKRNSGYVPAHVKIDPRGRTIQDVVHELDLQKRAHDNSVADIKAHKKSMTGNNNSFLVRRKREIKRRLGIPLVKKRIILRKNVK